MGAEVFCGKWKLIAGKPPGNHPVYHVHIEEPIEKDGKVYLIRYSCNGQLSTFAQELYFDEVRHTLSSRPDGHETQRCVAFWEWPDGRDSCIFAMWRRPSGSEEDRLPWETTGASGSWGAEAG